MTQSNDSTTHEFTLPDGTVVIIDAEDWPRVSQNKWYARKGRRTIYVQSSDRSQWPWRTIQLARFILDPPDGLVVDHINHDGLDNQKSNLRLATHAQNQQNRRPPIGREGLKGVVWMKRERKWRARIKANRQIFDLGLFESAEDAAAAYDEAAKQLHGEFAHLNSPENKLTG